MVCSHSDINRELFGMFLALHFGGTWTVDGRHDERIACKAQIPHRAPNAEHLEGNTVERREMGNKRSRSDSTTLSKRQREERM